MRTKFDPELAQALIGKTLLVGLVVVDGSGRLIEETRLHGRIIRASESEGVVIERSDTRSEFNLPPDTSNLLKAQPGQFRENPDYVSTWKVTRTKSH